MWWLRAVLYAGALRRVRVRVESKRDEGVRFSLPGRAFSRLCCSPELICSAGAVPTALRADAARSCLRCLLRWGARAGAAAAAQSSQSRREDANRPLVAKRSCERGWGARFARAGRRCRGGLATAAGVACPGSLQAALVNGSAAPPSLSFAPRQAKPGSLPQNAAEIIPRDGNWIYSTCMHRGKASGVVDFVRAFCSTKRCSSRGAVGGGGAHVG